MGLVRLPGKDNRLAIVGSTGTGKTQAGIFHLLKAMQGDAERKEPRPWFIFDFKRDKMIGQLNARQLPLTGALPTDPGLYVWRPIPEDQDDLVKDRLRKIWEQENAGVYIDEGYMMGIHNKWFNALLTQGRSKHIQMITLSQRPAWMSRFVFSESDFFQIFRLNDKRDYPNIQAMVGLDIKRHLPSYHSHWFDVAGNAGAEFAPVPGRRQIINDINAMLRHQIKAI